MSGLVMTPDVGLREWIRAVPEIRKNFLIALQGAHRKHGDAFRTAIPRPTLFLFHPEHVARVLSSHADNYVKSRLYRQLDAVLGRGMLSSDGAEWREQRRQVGSEFHASRVAEHSGALLRLTDEMIDGWSQGEDLDLGAEMNRVALRAAGHLMFGIELREKSDELAGALQNASRLLIRRIVSPVRLPLRVPTPANVAIRKSVRHVTELMDLIVNERRMNPRKQVPADVLDRLLGGERSAQTDSVLRERAITLLLAGHETTAVALTWTIYHLLQNPVSLQSVSDELERNGGPIDLDAQAVRELSGLRHCVQESLRLCPSVTTISRNAIQPDEVMGANIRAGELVQLSPWVTHRHPDFWSEPESYRPERFARRPVSALPEGSYLPFGLGPRECVGKHLAWLELMLIPARVLQRCRFRFAEPGFRTDARPGFTLSPQKPIHLKLVSKR